MIDHGMLNVPLAKRGCIDAQIDAYKAQKARRRPRTVATPWTRQPPQCWLPPSGCVSRSINAAHSGRR